MEIIFSPATQYDFPPSFFSFLSLFPSFLPPLLPPSPPSSLPSLAPSSPPSLPSSPPTRTGTKLHGPHPQSTATAEDPFLTGCGRARKGGVLGVCETGPGDVCIPSGRLPPWRNSRLCSHTERQPRDATHSQEGAYSYIHTSVSL